MQFHKLHIQRRSPFSIISIRMQTIFLFFLNTRTKTQTRMNRQRRIIERLIHAFFQLSAFEMQKSFHLRICEFAIIDHRYFIDNFRCIDERSSFFLLNKIINKNVICNKLQKNFILKLYCNLFKLFISIIDILLLISYDILKKKSNILKYYHLFVINVYR